MKIPQDLQQAIRKAAEELECTPLEFLRAILMDYGALMPPEEPLEPSIYHAMNLRVSNRTGRISINWTQNKPWFLASDIFDSCTQAPKNRTLTLRSHYVQNSGTILMDAPYAQSIRKNARAFITFEAVEEIHARFELQHKIWSMVKNYVRTAKKLQVEHPESDPENWAKLDQKIHTILSS